MTAFNNRDWLFDVQEGGIVNFAGQPLFGDIEFMGSDSFQDVWDVPNEVIDRALLDTPATVSLASTDVNDTSAGTGARTARIDGLDGSGVPAFETITLDGQTPVASVGTYTAIFKITVLTAGASDYNEGTIWCGASFTLGVPTTKYGLVKPEQSVSRFFNYTVPADGIATIRAVFITGGPGGKGMQIRIGIRRTTGIIEWGVRRAFTGGENLSRELRLFAPLLAGETLLIQAKGDQGKTGSLSCYMELIIEDTA
jgi:hypothetical protein